MTASMPSTASAAGAIVGFSAPLGGVIDYTTGTPATGIPPLTSTGCFSGQASLRGDVNVMVSVTVASQGNVAAYVGFASIAGTLTEGPCTNMALEVGSVSGLTLTGTGLTGGSLSCGTFAGLLDRVAAAVVLSATAPSCTVNGMVTGPVTMSLTGVWAPALFSPTAGITTPVAKAGLAGTLVVQGSF
ncbi:MAG TPA: hypothetical protein VGQ42_01580 [Candidatus Dormibacteraeota bacterium]|nr:hypothetical protein [Candidatus Dormibacteraeota bacterium]